MMGCKPRERILEAATRLFSEQGVQAVGVSTIVHQADVAVMTLYRQFGGKDRLIVATLEHWSQQWLQWLEKKVGQAGEDPEAQLTALWDALDSWFASEGFRGSLVTTAAAELRGRPDHPAHTVVAAHRAAMRRLLEELAKRAGSHEPARVAGQLQVLADGATAIATIGRPLDAADIRALANATLTAGSG